MNVITCIGFHGTGSGAVDDLLKEFDNCPSAKKGVECRFLQDPDGISDLEYNLIDNPHRLNSGFALKRYLRFAKAHERTYKKIFGDKWLEYSRDYIDSLISDRYLGYWHCDLLLLNPLIRLFYYFRRAVNKVMPRKLKKPRYYNYFPNIEYFHSYISREEFIEKTQNYCERLCYLLNPNDCKFVLLDQCVATSNIPRYISYIKNLKVIVVDRDPRDLYINQSLNGQHVLPKDPKIFARVYKDQRKMMRRIPTDLHVLQLKYEDLIYNYDDTVKQIMEFIGQDANHHIRKKQLFNPEVAIKNTKLWERFPQYSEEIKVIEGTLKEFLYKY